MGRKGFYIGGVIVFLAIAYLAYMGFADSAAYYNTVGELLDEGSPAHGRNVRVNGQVAPDSVVREPGGLTLSFTRQSPRFLSPFRVPRSTIATRTNMVSQIGG